MPVTPDTSSAKTRQTTLLVPSIHCSACALFVEELLCTLSPKPIAVQVSIAFHSINVEHDCALRASELLDVLENAGYGVEAAFSYLSKPGYPNDTINNSRHDLRTAWTLKRSRRCRTRSKKKTRKRHLEHCQQCQTQQRKASDADSRQVTVASPDALSAAAAGESAPARVSLSKASLSISGMSCSSCVGKITAGLEQNDWVRSASVALLTQSAVVEFEGRTGDSERLVRAVHDLGYEAQVERVDELLDKVAPQVGVDLGKSLWQGVYSIGGITCSSCIGNITEALKNLEWTISVDVNLITNSASVVFEDKSRLDDILDAIEAAGYDAKLDTLIDLSRREANDDDDGSRTVSIHVDGMHCDQCPTRVLEALGSLGMEVAVKKHATTQDPILTVSYVPRPPQFTVRTIISAIAGSDQAFKPTIHHPPTVEERAKRMHIRIRQRILYRVLLAMAISIPSFIIGIVYMTLVPEGNGGRRYLMQRLRGVTRAEWALFVLATPVYLFAADVFHRRSVKELYSLWRRGSPVPVLRRFYRFGSMDMLISLGTTIAYLSSVVDLIIATTLLDMDNMGRSSTYFDSVVFLTMFLLIGRLIEAYSKAKTGEAVTMLGDLRPKEALLMPSDERQEEGGDRAQSVAVDMLERGDIIRVVHGGSPPWDGTVLEGAGEFDESSLNGESRLVKKALGDAVYSGTVNKGGSVLVRITGVAGDSMLDQIIRVVREGQARRAPIERMADLLTSYFVPVVTLLAISTWLIWLLLGVTGTLPREYLDAAVGGWPFWSLQFAIAVFVIACPCGIGLAAPTALFVGGGLAAKHGILVKGGGEAFQEASGLDIIVFDKTGTLTQGGEPKITDHQLIAGGSGGSGAWPEQTICSALGELESYSSHPIGKAIVSFCEPRRSSVGSKARQVEEIPGKGMKASFEAEALEGRLELLAGNEALAADNGIALDEDVSRTLQAWKSQAKSVVLVAARAAHLGGEESAWTMVAIFAVSDPLRPESGPVVEALRRRGVEVWMLSGDNPTTANAVGALVGIPAEHVIAGVLPEQKADKVLYLQRSRAKRSVQSMLGVGFGRAAAANERAVVAMVGDGVNDAPALAVADVGIAIGSGSDVAISAADFVLVKSDLTTLLTLISLSRTVFRRVKFNFAWALAYNLVALPVAAGVLYPVVSNGQHVRLDPVWASLAMALSSVSVICSSLVMRSRLPVVGFREEMPLPATASEKTRQTVWERKVDV